MRGRKIVTLEQIVLLALVGTLALSAAMVQENWRMEIRLALAGFALFVFAVVVVALIVWVRLAWGESFERSERVRLVLALGHLNPEQLAALGQYAPIVELAGGESVHEPIQLWRIMGSSGETVPVAFIRRLIEAGSETALPAMRAMPEADYEHYRLVIGDFIQRGWLTPARGNQPARWLDRQSAVRQIFGGEE